jgi:hypothetical protein
MILEINSLIPLVTILGAAAAPTIAAIWSEDRRKRDSRNVAKKLIEMSDVANAKLDTIHTLVNSQLSQAVDRLTTVTKEIEELKRLVRELQNVGSARQGRGAS